MWAKASATVQTIALIFSQQRVHQEKKTCQRFFAQAHVLLAPAQCYQQPLGSQLASKAINYLATALIKKIKKFKKNILSISFNIFSFNCLNKLFLNKLFKCATLNYANCDKLQ